MARHSAKRASVRLHRARPRLALEVEDRGRPGFRRGVPRGLGLVAMRERAELLGGTLDVERRPTAAPASG